MDDFMTLCPGPKSRRLSGIMVVAAAAAILAGASAPLRAEDAPAPKVVATVDGQPITDVDVALAARDLTNELGQVPQEQRPAMALQALIDIKLFAKAAEAAGIDKQEDVQRRLELLRARQLRNEYLISKVGAEVNPDTIKKRYDEEMAKFVPGDEVHVEHILVKTEDEAKAIIADLDKGGDFAAIAKEKSLDPGSGQAGGDLGFIGRGKTVKPFEDAAFALEPGKYTEVPVKSDFGWHVIKLDEKRKEPTPKLEEVQDNIRQTLLAEFLEREQKAVRANADIKITGADAPADKASEAPAATEPAPAKPEQQ
jgi:peptidyl-prolyl cis-trans isomerase C